MDFPIISLISLQNYFNGFWIFNQDSNPLESLLERLYTRPKSLMLWNYYRQSAIK